MSYPDNGFHRNTTVSTPVEYFLKGAEKDSCEPGMTLNKPMPLRQVTGERPRLSEAAS